MARPAADRDLLFGMLALQIGLIEQGQLVAAFRAWTRDKRPPAGRPTGGSRRPRRRRTGRRRGAGGPAPEEARRRRRQEPRRDRRRAVRPASRSPPSATPRSSRPSRGSAQAPTSRPTAPPATPWASPAPDGQRFRVLRPHARGGLGAVFVALDAELHREVVLKQILDQHADDPGSRARFLLEAEITGGLEHPGDRPGLRPGGLRRRPAVLRHAVHPRRQPQGCRRPLPRRWCAEGRSRPPLARAAQAACGGSPTSAMPSSTRTAAACCTATSSRATSSWASTARRWWSTGAWPRRRAGPSPVATPASGRWSPPRPAARPRRSPACALGTPGVHEPRAGRGAIWSGWGRARTSTAWAPRCTTSSPAGRRWTGTSAMCSARSSGGSSVRPGSSTRRSTGAGGGLPAGDGARPEDRYASPKAMAEDIERWMADEPVSAWREPWPRSRRLVDAAPRRCDGDGRRLAGRVVGIVAVLAVQTQANAKLTRANTTAGGQREGDPVQRRPASG